MRLRISLFLAVFACGCSNAPSIENVATTSSAVTTVCGVDMHAGPQGIDVSKYNGDYDFNAAAARGVVWAYTSVGDGFDPNPYFSTHWQNMKSAGILRGAYQFFEPGEDEVAQANEVIAATGMLGDGDLPAAIDVEVTGGQSGAVIAAKVRHWIDLVRAGTGKTPIIYTGPYFWEDNVGAPFADIALWVADYGPSCPLIPDGWGNWLFWQYDDSGHTLDVDVFNGSADQLRALAGGGSRSNHANGGVASWSPDRLDLFMRTDGGALQHKSFASGWSDWESLGPSITNQPVAASWSLGRLDVLGRTTDGTLSHTYGNGSTFATDVIATNVASDPVVTSWGANRIDAFAVAKDHTLDHFFWNNLAWGRDSLRGDIASDPVVTSWSENRLDLLAIGSDGGMKHEYWDGTHWGAWESLPGNPASAISLVAWAPGRLDAFALAADHSVQHWYWGGAWGTDSLGGNFSSPPTVASWGEGRLDVFAIAADHTLQHATPVGYAWSAWENLGGSLATNRAPQVVAWAPNRLDIFAEGTDRAMWHFWWNGTKWGTWENLGGKFADDDDASDGGASKGIAKADAGNGGASKANASSDGDDAGDGGGCSAVRGKPAPFESALLVGLVLLGLLFTRRTK